MRSATKGEKAKAALEVCVDLLNKNMHGQHWHDCALEVGRWGALSHYAGYLSTKQIDEALALTTENLGDVNFADEYHDYWKARHGS